jgi:hypothetical protein
VKAELVKERETGKENHVVSPVLSKNVVSKKRKLET